MTRCLVLTESTICENWGTISKTRKESGQPNTLTVSQFQRSDRTNINREA